MSHVLAFTILALLWLSPFHNLSLVMAFTISAWLACEHFAKQIHPSFGPKKAPIDKAARAMTHHWKLEDFLAELGHMEQLAKLRPDGKAVHSMATNFTKKLEAAEHWSSEAMVGLITKVNQTELPEEAKGLIHAVIDSLAASEGGHLKLTLSKQQVQNLAMYLTKSDWDEMAKGSQMHSIDILCKRLRAMGLSSMKEDTKKQCAALLLYTMMEYHDKPEPTPHAKKAMCEDIADVFQATPPCPKVHGLAIYPLDPKDCGEGWLAKAYPDQPPQRQEINLKAWAKKATWPIQHYFIFVFLVWLPNM